MTSRLFAAGVLVAAVIPAPVAAAAPAAAHQVTYTVTAQQPVSADIYYRDTEPPNWADYSHNPYRYSPKASADIGPHQPWTLSVALADPDRWAMVSATRGSLEAGVRCELAVDGVVVAPGEGPRGALCSLRHW